MLQFYFLSILLNIAAGLILVYANDFMSKKSVPAVVEDSDNPEDIVTTDDDTDTSEESAESKNNAKVMFYDDMTFRLVIAVVSALVGLMKLLSTVQNDVPVVGDLLPAVAGMAAGFALLIEYYTNKSDVNFNLPPVITSVFVGGRKYLGIFCIMAGVLHFVFPRVLFL